MDITMHLKPSCSLKYPGLPCDCTINQWLCHHFDPYLSQTAMQVFSLIQIIWSYLWPLFMSELWLDYVWWCCDWVNSPSALLLFLEWRGSKSFHLCPPVKQQEVMANARASLSLFCHIIPFHLVAGHCHCSLWYLNSACQKQQDSQYYYPVS